MPAFQLQRLSTEPECEAPHCKEVAVWLVTFRDCIFFWCPKHTVERMRDIEFWLEWNSVSRKRPIKK